MKLSLSLLSIILAMALAVPFSVNTKNEVDENQARPKPCKTAAQWEGRSSEWDHNTEENNRYTISFDAISGKKRVLEDKRSYIPGRRVYEYFYDYNTMTFFKVNVQYQTCKKYPISGPWQNHSIPEDAVMEDEYEIGPPGEGLQVREWSDRIPGRAKESWIGIFSIEGCWPIVEVITYSDETANISLTTRFFDITPGIQNMSVFNPPDVCFQEQPEEPDEQELTWYDKLLALFGSDDEDEREEDQEEKDQEETDQENTITYEFSSVIPDAPFFIVDSSQDPSNDSIISWYYDLKGWFSKTSSDDVINSIKSQTPSIAIPTISPQDVEDAVDKFVNYVKTWF